VIDGEAIVCDDNGLPVFDLIRNYCYGSSATLCASMFLNSTARTCGIDP
jgi:hypothetical protein